MGRIHRYRRFGLTDGNGLGLPVRWTSEKFRALSTIIAKPPSVQKPRGLTGLSFTRLTATCPINFYRMASISEPIYTWFNRESIPLLASSRGSAGYGVGREPCCGAH